MEAREGNHVDRQLAQVSVQLTGEPEALYFIKRRRINKHNDVSATELERDLCVAAQDKFMDMQSFSFIYLRQVVTPDMVRETRWFRSP